MLTNKGYYIPKYLYKRKIEIIRQKIIKRKFGYLFYRKTVSKILPSQAQEHYTFCLQRKYFKRWVLLWYKEMIEWKLILRADIHYKLNLKQSVFRKWKYFHIQYKTARIKEQIALAHYQKHYIRQLNHFYFYKWKLYTRYRTEKKYKMKFAWNFFKSKYKPSMLLQYFNRWNLYAKASKKNNLKMLNARKYYEKKLLHEMLIKLRIYTNYRNIKSERIRNVIKLYERNLGQKVINNWCLFTKQKQQKTQNMLLAEAHYRHKLIFNAFSSLLRNKNRNVHIRYSLEVFRNLQTKRQKLFYFIKLKKYLEHRQLKKQKMCDATISFNKSLKKKALNGWKRYLYYLHERELIEQQLLNTAIIQLNVSRLQRAFKKWTLFMKHKMERKLKKSSASHFYIKCILRNTIKMWGKFILYKKAKLLKKMNAVLHYNHHLERLCFKMWKTYFNDERYFKQKLQEATEYYHRRVVNEGLLLIVKAGLNKKEENLRISKERVYYQLFLAQKYLSIWKRNTLYKNVDSVDSDSSRCEEKYLEDKENIPQDSNFGWYPVCFLTPRPPKNYLRDYFHNT